MTGAPIRRCPECGEEFQPHIVNCSDCGALLADGFEGAALPGDGGAAAPLPSAEEYVGVLSGMEPEVAAEASQHLTAAGIPFAMVSHASRGLRLGVAPGRVLEAMKVLQESGLVPAAPESSEGAVAIEGGPCPACGEHVHPGSSECAGCGLSLSGSGRECRHCGADLNPVFDACAECGREQD
ncbi:MAG TPA: hypothetical protein VFO85_15205 [Vicinamibacteria bacterium]|nr:hypothetical protein [Vicinamibacteria bacterium]